MTEDAPLRPVTPYGESKVLAERDVCALAAESFSPIFLRNATVYGASPRMRFDLVLNNLVAWACATRRIYLKSDGRAWRPLVHAEDVARAFIAVIHAPREAVHNQTFNVARNDDNHRIREIAEIIAATVPDCHIEHAAGAECDARNYRVDGSKLCIAVPTFKPQWSVLDGVRELYEFYRGTVLTPADFEGPRYHRRLHLEQLISEGRLDTTLRRTEAVPQS